MRPTAATASIKNVLRMILSRRDGAFVTWQVKPRPGSDPGRVGSVSLAVLAAGEALELVERVRRLDPADGAGPRTHHDRVGYRAVRQIADAAQQGSGRNAGRGHENVLSGNEVVGRQHTVEVVAGVDQLLALLVVAGPQL